ncbi:hypothetical protein HNQ93_004360 [Hymenobacter luteus]|uniref:DUF2946 domain-containing protein n=2 Tax=Hymenobacter TaxID=89966 RepID=A0A7W9WD07_9BACT|nr:hypothetical protein [Hymenobacter latericoloratus]MBB6061479.1 hypothetical protein [Hymenobacter luteus]
MRFLSLLFALYFAVLGCLPCTDEALPTSSETAFVTSANHSHNKSSEIDWCSPLCQCHCCPGAIMLPVRVAAFAPVPVPPMWGAYAYAPAGSDALPVRPLATPWQPPQGA